MLAVHKKDALIIKCYYHSKSISITFVFVYVASKFVNLKLEHFGPKLKFGKVVGVLLGIAGALMLVFIQSSNHGRDDGVVVGTLRKKNKA